LVFQVWSEGILYSKLISAEGVPPSGRLANAGGNIEISQILADGSGLGTEQGSMSALWRIDLQSASQEPEKVRTIPWTDRLLQVSPDGRFLAFATNRNGPTQVLVSRFDGSQSRTLVSSIPPFGSYGDSTGVADISWSPDGNWIALLTEPGVGHGVDDARLFLVPTAGGRLQVLVELCSQVRDSTPWSANSQSVFISKEDQQYKASYFQVDLSSGTQTPVLELPASPRHLTLLPPEAEQPHLAQGGRFLYFERRKSNKRRLVAVRNLLTALQ
jgi:WD40 repeat protein